jgi:hypothetical protein
MYKMYVRSSDESSCVAVCKASLWNAAPCCVAVVVTNT